MTSYEEWRVTGAWDGEPREEVFSPRDGYITPEETARAFVAREIKYGVGWTDGPHLSRRRVTVTEWEETP